jgi:multidrug efflux system outer membrane protein
MTRWLLIVGVALVAASCTLGPNYRRPPVELPAAYRGAAETLDQSGSASVADVQWFDLFKDDTLTQTVNTALAQNFDLRIAAERVLQARERVQIVRSDQFPGVNGSAAVGRSRFSEVGVRPLPSGADPQVSSFQAGFTLGWELDVWGRLRRLSESARARYLATEEARRGIVTTLVADVTDAYFALQTFDRQLVIAQRTRDVAADNLRLTQLRRDRGVATGLDVRQAEQLLFTTTGQIASLQRDVAQTEDFLSLLLGQVPGDRPRGPSVDVPIASSLVPAGLPSSLLERRPDIRQAEMELVAANAQIGVAKADYFPRIGLTSGVGGESRALSDLLTASASTWFAGASAAAPIFNAGRTRANVRLSESAQRELVVVYQRTIYRALREVSDALVGYRKTGEQRVQQQRLVDALRDAARLSTDRYQGGLDSYLQVLDAQRSLFRSELDLAALQRLELASIVELYRALGGGWTAQP